MAENKKPTSEVEAPYGINPKNGKPYTYWQEALDESSPLHQELVKSYGDQMKAANAGFWSGWNDLLKRSADLDTPLFSDPMTAIPKAGYAISNYLVGFGDKRNYDSYKQRIEEEPVMMKKNDDGSFSFYGDTFPDFVAKLWAKKKKADEEKYNDAIEPSLEELMVGDGAGEKQSGGIALPGIGAMPKISMPDYAALRKKLDELDIDAQYEAPQKNPLVMIGQALANIDLTSNLAGDWSKTAKIAADYQQYNEEQAKSAKNKNADKKAEIAMWKAMKDISLQEAEADAAMKQAEFGLRWQQLKNEAALQQAKANMFYGPNGYYGRLTKAQLDYADMQKAENLGMFAGQALKKEKPKMTSEQAMKVLMPKLTQMKAMGFPQNRVNSYINGYLMGVTGGTQGDK